MDDESKNESVKKVNKIIREFIDDLMNYDDNGNAKLPKSTKKNNNPFVANR